MSGSAIKSITNKADLSAFVSASKVAVVEYKMPGCPPCQSFQGTYDLVAKEMDSKDIRFAEISIEDMGRATLADGMDIHATPTLTIYRDGRSHDMIIGAMSNDEFRARVRAAAAN